MRLDPDEIEGLRQASRNVQAVHKFRRGARRAVATLEILGALYQHTGWSIYSHACAIEIIALEANT